ncbi:hypothetical protein P3T73_04525 [Kiritimatiellota bacterium B12222]|nr:hypothetical protein P3T73_04525 [Kiritimatiellota bacterium B12222]
MKPTHPSPFLHAFATAPKLKLCAFCMFIVVGGAGMAQPSSQSEITTETPSTVAPEKMRSRLVSGVDRTVNEKTIKVFYTYSSKTENETKNAVDILAGYTFGDKKEWGLKLAVPFESVDPGDDRGLSDIRVLLNRSFRVTEGFRVSAAVGGRLNTAKDLTLGNGSDDLILEANSSHEFNPYLRVKLGLGYEYSLYTEPGGKEENKPYFSVGLHGTLLPSSTLLWNANYDIKHNRVHDKTDYTLIFGLRYLLGEQKRWVLEGVYRLPVIKETNLHYELGAGVSLYF